MWANVEPTKSDGVSGSPVLVALALRAFDLRDPPTRTGEMASMEGLGRVRIFGHAQVI